MRPREVIALAATALVFAACAGAPAAPAKTDMAVALNDTSIVATPVTAPAGEVSLNVTSNGTTLHEIEVFTVPAGVDADNLPVEGFLADTEGAGMELVDEIDIIPQATPTLTIDLAAGRYALICNLPGHYALGMHTTVTIQ